jgi:hypothetical protein
VSVEEPLHPGSQRPAHVSLKTVLKHKAKRISKTSIIESVTY